MQTVSTRRRRRPSRPWEAEVELTLTPREVRTVLSWRRGGAFFPDEDRVRRKLVAALDAGRAPRLSRLQVGIVSGWAEEQVGGHYGGGAVANPDEASILRKLQEALEAP